MEIKYICRPTGFCETRCPHGKAVYVGSDACQDCEYYVTSDDTIVTCNADEAKDGK